MRKLAKEFGHQMGILLFGKSKSKPRSFRYQHRKYVGAHHQYNKAQNWAKRNGYKK